MNDGENDNAGQEGEHAAASGSKDDLHIRAQDHRRGALQARENALKGPKDEKERKGGQARDEEEQQIDGPVQRKSVE